MLGESREGLSPRDAARGSFTWKRRCADRALEKWYEDTFPRFMEACRDLILASAGEDEVEGLILTGSFASGEGSVAMVADEPLILSDIDFLLIVSSPRAHAAVYPARAGIGARCEDLLPGARFEGGVDVGVMTAGELGALPRSPGVYMMRNSGVVLHGDARLLERMPLFEPAAIGKAEALRLLENRAAAFLGGRVPGARPEGIELYGFLYEVSKVYTDIVTASLCAAGLFLPGYSARAGFLSSREAEKAVSILGKSLIGDAEEWTRFKVDPSGAPPWTERSDAGRMWLVAAADLLAVLDRISVLEDSVAETRPVGMADILRAWRAFLPGRPGSWRVYAEALLSRRTPGAWLRERAVKLVRHAVERGTGGDVSPAPAGYPHGGIAWDRAASETASEWRRLVKGRVKEK